MKVLFTFSGLPHYYNPILNRLNAVKGIEIHVVVPKEQSSALGSGVHQSKENIEFTVHYLEEYKAYYGKNYFRNFVQFLKQEKPDIIVTAWPYVLAFLLHAPLIFFIKRTGTKVILKEIPFQVPLYHKVKEYYHTGNFFSEEADVSGADSTKPGFLKYLINTMLRKMFYWRMDAFVNYVEEAYEIISSYGIPKERIFITYNSPDTDYLLSVNEQLHSHEPLLPANPYRIIHIGRLVYWKRVDLLFKAAAIVQKKFPQLEVVVIGDGPEKNNLHALAERLGIQTHVRFTGSLYDSMTIGKYLQESSLYVLAGMGGLSINEAMCFGKPVICSVCDGTEKKLVREDYNGKYFQSNDEQDLARVIETLLSQPKIIQEMGARSLEIIRNEVNVHVVLRGYVQAFSYVLKTPIHL